LLKLQELFQQIMASLDSSPFAVFTRPVKDFAVFGESRARGESPAELLPRRAADLPPTFAFVICIGSKSAMHEKDQLA
jgi:hypothetical protein